MNQGGGKKAESRMNEGDGKKAIWMHGLQPIGRIFGFGGCTVIFLVYLKVEGRTVLCEKLRAMRRWRL